jgi:hypothetical protein
LVISSIEALLNIGMTLAILSSDGKTPVDSELLMIWDRIGLRTTLLSFNILEGMLSHPQEQSLRLLIIFSISLSVAGLRKIFIV